MLLRLFCVIGFVYGFAPIVNRLPSSPNRIIAVRASENEESTELAIYGGLGSAASLVVFISEFKLKTTGCGLPAGPGGLYGAVEGISYLAIVGIIGASITTKIKTGKGLPPGPFGLLGAAEGLAYLAALTGIIVLFLQIQEYGYIPNAVPVEGGVCS
uniref:Uncharacterized protein n=1 Tax=Aureoumbra lagunensis TaxID=44058 RepID=A0A7S3K5U6_9STRA